VARASGEAVKPLQLTSSTHAFAYSVYGKAAGFGALMVAGAVSVKAMAAIIFLPVFGLAFLIEGLVGLYAIRAASTSPNPDSGLRLERVACWVLLLVNGFLSVSLFIAYGIGAGLFGQVYVIGVAAGFWFRLRQIQRDRARLHAALNHARPADDATLAEPRNNDDEGVVMDLSAVALSIVAAIGTLTPLTLGVLSHFKDKKKSTEQPAIPATAMGETVDFESIAVQSLNAQIKMLNDTLTETKERCALVTAQRDANAKALRDAGLPVPLV
jgi:hypothetical protein